MILVDLFPTSRKAEWGALELACEYIERRDGEPFSVPQLARASSYHAAVNAVQSLLALDLIQRISPRGARPVMYEARPTTPHPVNPASPRPQPGPPRPPTNPNPSR